MKTLSEKQKYLIYIAVAVLLMFIIPMLFAQTYTGHDYQYHLGRIRCIADNIDNGLWFSPVYYSALNGFGYASPLFYGDIFLHFPALLVHFGMSAELAYRLFLFIVTACTAISAFLCFRNILKDDKAGFVAAFVYTFSSYYCVDALTRAAIGELQAFIFLPIIFYGFYSVVFGDCKKWYLLSLGLAGCLISHILSAFVAVVIMAFAAVIFISRLLSEKHRFYYIAISAGVFFGVSAFFILPLVEMLSSGSFVLTNGMSATRWGTLSGRSMPIQFVFSDFSMGTYNGAWIPNGLGLFPIVAIIFFVINSIKAKKADKKSIALLFFGAVLLISTTNIFPWGSLQDLCGSLQFPWRLLVFALIFFALFAGNVVKTTETPSPSLDTNAAKAIKAPSLSFILIILLIGTSVFSYISTGKNSYKNMLNKANSGEETVAYRTMIGAGEYLPMENTSLINSSNGKSGSNGDTITAIKSYMSANKSNLFSNNLSSEEMSLQRNYNGMEITFENNSEENTYIDIPLLMYKGYTAYINGEPIVITNGSETKSVTVNKVKYDLTYDGIARIYLGSNTSGTVSVKYEGTSLQLIGKIITALTVAFLIWLNIFNRKKARKQSQIHNPAPVDTE